jgi:multiple sugar transport system permease protein
MKRKTFFQFSAPSNIIMIGIMVIPLFMAIWLGMNRLTFRNINSPQFIGLQNYLEVLADPRFFKALQFTLLIMVITVPLQMTIGFVAALLLDQIAMRWRGIFMAGMLLPFIVVPVVGSMMVKQLFEPSGLASWFFREVIEQRFVLMASTIRPIIYLHTIWYVTPFAIVAFYAGMQTVRKDLVDSAAIDGASRLQQIRHVMIPHLRSVIIFIFLISIMDAYRIFDNIFVFSELNPIYNADTVMTYNFITAISFNRLGKANAMAILVVIGILVVLIPFIIVTYRDQIRER